MKKFVIVQIALIVFAIILGGLLKGDPDSGIRDFHRALGMIAGLSALVTLITAYKSKSCSSIKILAGFAFILLLSAALGGGSLRTTENYDASYGQMTGSAILALITSIVLVFKVRKEALTAHTSKK
jgi:heme A synthase